jgi:site-specific DNA-cytosine methylase
MGLRKGIKKGTRSGLVREVFRLADELQPQAIFLENVPQVLNHGLKSIIRAFVAERGYEMRWAVIPASAMGAPHLRKRFFALIFKPKWRRTWRNLSYKPASWTREPQRMVPPGTAGRGKRVSMLGNAVVPDCVRAAFITLAEGFTAAPHPGLASTRSIKLRGVSPVQLTPCSILSKHMPSWGLAHLKAGRQVVYSLRDVPEMMSPQLKLRLDPSKFGEITGERHIHPGMRGSVSARIIKTVQKAAWSTPRAGLVHASNVLTERTQTDLPTQVRYEARTPERLRHGQISPGWVEWLMGFPSSWTAVPVESHSQSPQPCLKLSYRRHGQLKW